MGDVAKAWNIVGAGRGKMNRDRIEPFSRLAPTVGRADHFK
jgi:hypothetical protein